MQTEQQQPQSLQQVQAAYQKARELMLAGDLDEAEGLCRRTLPRFEQDPNIRCLLGEILIKQRRPQEARGWFSKTLKLLPDFPRALEGLGLVLLAEQKPKEALPYLQKVAAAVPNRSKTQLALARALAQTGHGAESEQALARAYELDPNKAALAKAAEAKEAGRIDEAEQLVRDVLAKNPKSVAGLRLLGQIALDANRPRAARSLLMRAVKLEPGFILAWNDLANAWMKDERFDRALEAVEKAIELDPTMPLSRVIKGNVLAKAQRHEEAVEAYREALTISPQHNGALSGMGHVLKTIGRTDESIEAYRTCTQAHPAFGEAYWSLANLKTFEFEPEEVEVMLKMVEDPKVADEPKVNFHYSLGKHFENEKDYDRAFRHYRDGSDLRRTHEMYDPVQTQVIHDRIIETFDREFLDARTGWGDPHPDPILIVGLPRSGSTLIEQILASHSQVEGTMELPDLSRAIRDINRSRKDRVDYPEAVADLPEHAVRELGERYIEGTRRYRTDTPFFIDKMPNNFSAIGLLHLILPNAKVINARRHPLDSCLGSYKQLFFKGQSFTYDLFELGQYYLQYQRVMDHWHKVLPGKVLDVHYEQVVADQENQTRRILAHCGLPWEDQCLRFYETERAVNTASSEQVRRPIYTKAVNFWRHYEDHLEELIGILEPLLVKLPKSERPASLQAGPD
jgi:tetratricopeptide (TPR) repeat protein